MQTPALPDIDPALREPCWAGPAWPEGDRVTLQQLLDVAIQREAAAAECRARHARLVQSLRPP